MEKEALMQLRDKVLKVVNEAAAFINTQSTLIAEIDVTEKGKNSLVSYVDRQSEEILIKGLSSLQSEAGFITEEEMTSQSLKDLTWIIDPLDGTTNFLHDVPCFSISVALYDGSEIILGVVHEVTRQEVFHATKDSGAFMNDTPLSVTNRTSFHDVLIGTGFPYTTDQTVQAHFETLKEILWQTRGIRRLGSAAVDLCYVACGRFGAFYENSLNSYDIAAGALIVKEAGGFISDFKGEEKWLFEGEILATAPQFKDQMLSALRWF
ncbi:MAG: inositol monophosphatase [Saprospiraceae bacterium]|nr:inositol monophosphatase [Saprospiraceae bacterium]